MSKLPKRPKSRPSLMNSRKESCGENADYAAPTSSVASAIRPQCAAGDPPEENAISMSSDDTVTLKMNLLRKAKMEGTCAFGNAMKFSLSESTGPFSESTRTRSESTRTLSESTSTLVSKDLLLIGKHQKTQDFMFFAVSPSDGTCYELDNIGSWDETTQTITAFHNQVYLIGGQNESGNIKSVKAYVYDMQEKVCLQLPDLHLPRANPTVFICNNILYACGGDGRASKSLTQVECLELAYDNSTWMMLTQMKTRRGKQASCCMSGNIAYIVGGGTNRCECFDCDTKTWRELPALPDDFCLHNPLIVAIKGRIIVFKCYRPTKMYTLEKAMNSWQIENIRCQPPECLKTATTNADAEGKIYAVDNTLKVYSLDVIKPRWKFEMKIHLRHFAPISLSALEL